MSGLSKIAIIAGPNGAGKTSFARQLLALLPDHYVFVNADEIARELAESTVAGASLEIQAARAMLSQIDLATLLGENVMFETTLASTNWSRHIPFWRSRGYAIQLIYLRLASPDLAVARVRRRVEAGGHDIPERTIRRRFSRSLVNLEAVYKDLVDEWQVYESQEHEAPRLLEAGRRI